MNAEQLLNALGEVDEMMIKDAKEHRKTIKRKKLYIGLVAAVVAAGALGLGAVVAYKQAEYSGEYPFLYQLFFSKKSETKVEYDFTDFGEELGDTIEFEGGMLRMRSVIADDTRAYLIYDVELTDPSVIPEGVQDAYAVPYVWYTDADGERRESTGTGEPLEQPYEGMYTFCFAAEFGEEGITSDGCITYDFPCLTFLCASGSEEEEDVDSVTVEINKEYNMQLDFLKEGTSVEKTMEIPLSEQSQTYVTKVKLSPFTLRVTFSKYLALDAQQDFYGRFSVIYEDGTEEVLDLDTYVFDTLPEANADGTKPALLDITLKKPVDYEKAVSIRFDDLELPLR